MENIRFVLIVILSMISLMLWEAWQVDYGPKPEVPAQTAIDANGNPINIGTENSQDTSELPLSEVAANNIITVTTDVYRLEIDTQGGTIRNLDLLDYSVVKGEEQKIRLFDSSAEKLFLGQSGLLSGGASAKLPNHNVELHSEKLSYQLQDDNSLSVPLTWADNNGLSYTKTYTFTRGSYAIQLDQKVQNNSTSDWTGRQYTQLLRVPHTDEKGNTFIRTYSGAVVYTEEDKYQKIDFEDMAEEDLKTKSVGGWSAMIQHYFATAWVPPAADEQHYFTKELSNSRFVIGSYSEPATVAANSSAVFKSQLFAGPKIQPVMEAIAPGLELTVDYSWLTIIGKPIYALLNWIHDNVVNNWGFAIMGVTLCIKALFFPLSAASYKSMANMRKLQPRLAQLKESYGDDRQRFNEEMMSLYRKEKVNPMGGCLPIMVQIPVFISLYWVLIETVELRQAPFLLWVQDLSAKDPYFVLPVIMGITMFLQQRLNPAPVDPLQAKIMRMFPIVFTVFFLFFPAGLVLYWVTNNTLSIIQQWYITNKIVGKD